MSMSSMCRRTALAACACAMTACGLGSTSTATSKEAPEGLEVFEGPVPVANCGPGSRPEPDLQGRVPIEDRTPGPNGEPPRSTQGYTCNLELKGQDQNQGASWQFAWYDDCGYYGTVFTGGNAPANPNMGVQVIDGTNPEQPARTRNLITPAMLDPWESLKVNERRGLLGAVAGWNVAGPLMFDVYDVKEDCRYPTLMSSTPTIVAGHEGNWAPDGLTYYVGTGKGIVDVSNPQAPVPIHTTDANGSGHGLSLNKAGTRMYAVNGSGAGGGAAACSPNGLTIYDTSQVQARRPAPSMPIVGSVCWEDGATAQHTIPVFYGTKPFVIFVDELGKGAARIINIEDETNPYVVSKLKLQIHMEEFEPLVVEDTAGNGSPFRYEAHYCGVDREQDPTALACGYFQSGVRVFDIRDPYKPRELAYFNPPAQFGKRDQLKGSEHAHGFIASASPPNLTADWCSAQVRFVERPNGEGELWTTCQDNGFLILKFTNGAWPIR